MRDSASRELSTWGKQVLRGLNGNWNCFQNLRSLEARTLGDGLLWNTHVKRDRVEAAYRKTDLFEDRREPMAGWGDYLM